VYKEMKYSSMWF